MTQTTNLIFPSLNLFDKPIPALQKVRVACYIRVSTDNPEQEDSYEAQERYFSKLLLSRPDWDSAGVYADYGISGTKKDNRTGLKRLLRHCEQGRINRVICKSISRLSRNTADTVEIIRKLKLLGVTCYFEKEDLDTGDMKSEFILTTLAALAQEESRTISENIHWSMEKRSPRGDVPNMRCYGYELSDEFETTETGYKRRKVVIVPNEAEIVKKIFMFYVDGRSIAEITRILNGEKVPAPDSKCGWMNERIRYILKNERYCGDVLTHKTYTEDFLTHKNKRNKGEIQQYYIKDHHPAIISREMFQKAQKRRKKDTNARKRREYRYSGRLVCAHCGKNYAAIRERYAIFWKCSSAMLNNGMQICNAERISQIMLDLMLINAVDARFPDNGELIAKLESTQDLDFMERDRSIMKKQIIIAEMELDDAVTAYEELQNKIEVLKIRQEIFGEKTDLSGYLCRCYELKNTITTLENEKSALESELDSKEKHWELLERDYAMRGDLIDFLKTASEKELRNKLPCYVKALVLSIIMHDTEHFTVRWFDETETDTTI